MRTDRELDRELERLAGLVKPPASVLDRVMKALETEPLPTQRSDSARLAPDVPTDGADGVACATRPKKQPPRRRHVPRRFMAMFQSRSVRWSVAGAAAAAIMLAIGLWPSSSGHGPSHGIAWAEVVSQIREARTAHIRMVQRDPSLYEGKDIVADMYVRAPDLFRAEGTDPSTQRRRVWIQHGHDCYILHPAQKQFFKTLENAIKPSAIESYLAFLGAFPVAGSRPGATAQPVAFGGHEARLELVAQQNRNGRNLEKYRLEFDKLSAPTQEATTHNYCWYDPAEDAVSLITVERLVDGSPVEVMRMEVSLNVELLESLFSLPADYSEAAESVAAPGLAEVAAAYDQARHQITKYRLVAWETRVPGWGLRPAVRSARDGERWRADETGSPAISIDTEFEILWTRLNPSRYGVSIFADQGRQTRILWDDGKIGRQQPGDDPNLNHYLLAGCGWPKWPSTVASTLSDDSSQFRRLPDRSDRPGQIGIAYTQSATGPEFPARLVVLWIDPAKDYLCVHYEEHSRHRSPWESTPDWQPDEPLTDECPEGMCNENDYWREITEFGQTPEGRWYPKTLRNGGASVRDGKRKVWGPTETLIQADFTGPIAAELFDLPTGAAKQD